MSENYLVINGNKTELTKEQLEQLGIETKKLAQRAIDEVILPFERGEIE